MGNGQSALIRNILYYPFTVVW